VRHVPRFVKPVITFGLLALLALSVSSAAGALELGAARCSPGRTAVVVNSRHVCRTGAELNLRLFGSPDETRVGGEATYLVIVSNTGGRAATNLYVSLSGDPAALLSLTPRGVSCSRSSGLEGGFAARCSSRSLAPHAQVRIELAVRAVASGNLFVRGNASSDTREVSSKNNAGVVKTSVLLPDSVHVAASRDLPGHQAMSLTLDAISDPHGQDPEGTFTLDSWDKVSGHVVCLSVYRNQAFVGVAIDAATPPPAPGETATGGLLFFLADNGSPGLGRDAFTFGGGNVSSVYSCGAPWLPVAPAIPAITSGEIAVVDTP
jgi:uncharacterized protein DUF11